MRAAAMRGKTVVRRVTKKAGCMQHPANQHSDKSSDMPKIPDRGEGPQTSSFAGEANTDIDWGQLVEIEDVQPYAPPPPSVPTASAQDEGDGLQWPPGRAGVFARLIFDTSYSPVREVAIAATLGLLAGVCGRAYRTYTGKDLALYLIQSTCPRLASCSQTRTPKTSLSGLNWTASNG